MRTYLSFPRYNRCSQNIRSFTSDVGKSLIASIGLQNEHSERINSLLEKLTVIEEAVRAPKPIDHSQTADDQIDRFAIRPSGADSSQDYPDDGSQANNNAVIPSAGSMNPIVGSNNNSYLPTPKRCPSWCSCCCHSKTTYILPRFLAAVFGATVMEFVNEKTKCNEYSCQRSRKATLNMSYGLPAYITHQYLLLKWTRAPIGSPAITLHMPRTMDWNHPLWCYAPKGDISAIKKLFSTSKAKPDDINFQGETTLHYAAFHSKLYRFMIELGADWNVINDHGRRPVDLIGQRLLIGAVPEEDALAIREHIVDTDFMESRQFTTIHKIVLQLLSRDLKQELENSTADINTVDTLGRTPLIWATMRDDLATVRTLIAFEADTNISDDEGNTALHHVRSADVCTALVRAGANIEARNSTHKQTSVHCICKTVDNPELINVLHDFGADIDAREADDETPLINAIFSRFTKTAEKLIELGANVNAVNRSSKEGPIHFAVAFGHDEILPLLIEQGADYAALNRRGSSLAHMVAAFATCDTVQVLSTLSLSDLDPSCVDDEGKTPEDRLSDREALQDSEVGLHESFARFTRSIAEAKAQKNLQRRESGFGKVMDQGEDIHVPGAYPSID